MGTRLSPLLRQFALQDFACKESVDECCAANRFTGDNGVGFPQAGVVRDSSGNLYGTTQNGGSSNAGTVFKVDPTGKKTVLYSFTGSTDGGYPWQAWF